MMEKNTNGPLYIKNNKVILEANKFIYEKLFYAVNSLSISLIDSKILESSKFLEDSFVIKQVKDQKVFIYRELLAAPKQWIDSNQFTLFVPTLKKPRAKKSKN